MTGRRPAAWDRGWLPVATGKRPEAAVTLADLGDGTGVDHLVARLQPVVGPGRREGALTVLHLALGVVLDTVLAPYVVDGVAVAVAPDRLGAVLRPDGTPVSVWVGEWSTVSRAGERVGATLGELLAPVVASVSESAGLHPRAVRTVVDDKLRAESWRLLRRYDRADGSRVEEVLRGTGFVPRVPQRWVMVRPDGGDQVRLPVPSVCCVLHTRAFDSACPTCPKHDAAARTRRTEEWLASLDEEGFRDVAGWQRVVAPG